ncbi:MAG: hypothetical protein LC808_02225 [Actinobacteria bacterium]|nr:hypothetical protein [Actinomycetota bacterium]
MSSMTDVEEGDVQLALVARAVRACMRPAVDFDAEFARATIYAQRAPDRPGVRAAALPGKGHWVLVFSTPERLARCLGDCAWLSTIGADLLEQLPVGLGVLLDIQDKHSLPLLPQSMGQARFGGAILPSKRNPRPRANRTMSPYVQAPETDRR